MNDNTINGDKTVAGGGKDMTLAGRYHILRQFENSWSLPIFECGNASHP